MLEHLDDPLNLLKDLRSRMIGGGLLVLGTPDCTGVTAISDVSAYRNIHPLEHINGFTPSSLMNIAQRAGFDAVPRAPAFATTELPKVARGVARYVLGRRTTEQYLRSRGTMPGTRQVETAEQSHVPS